VRSRFTLLLFVLFFTACRDGELELEPKQEVYLRAADLSSLPEIRQEGTLFYDESGQVEDALRILKEAGMNCVRLRLWVNPINGHSSLDAVENFVAEIRSQELGLWLSVHYSDTWADPGNQSKPLDWENHSFSQLRTAVRSYTAEVLERLDPDYIQIGNEINNGFLFPEGHRYVNPDQFTSLLSVATTEVRKYSDKTQIILHHAGIEGAAEFFSDLNQLDYDIAGISYYPIWHGKDLQRLEAKLDALRLSTGKNVVIAETAYPFTLDWNDWTNNIVGLEEQLILPDYSATETGQSDFMNEIEHICRQSGGIGWSYWGAELIAFRGDTASNGSAWENQALFDFEQKALPVLGVFRANKP